MELQVIEQGAGFVPWIALIPLLGAAINGVAGRRLGKTFASFVAILAPALSFFLAAALFVNLAKEDNEAAGIGLAHFYEADLGAWIAFSGYESRFNFVFDRLSAVMTLVITGVGSLIHLYSISYMEHEDDGGYARYFTYLNLFVGAMLILVLAGDLLLLFVGWEGVGLCSYLLIGFFYQETHNAACGTKAFLINRIGDLCFVLGLFCLVVFMSQPGNLPEGAPVSLDMQTINAKAAELGEAAHGGGHGAASASDHGGDHGAGHSSHPVLLGLACLLLFLGATGKSAQFPLHIWLPDAMAGPTPVSALIHAATMVTAGIYLIVRMGAVYYVAFLGDIPVLGIVAVVGVFTAFMAGSSALAQDDIKKVLAYSTVSQLGYMFVGVGCGAYAYAIFHLVTHAFFKALLFLGAGAVIHSTHTQSMKEMGGLRRYMPLTFWTMLIGSAALAGLPLMSGFFSKDAILGEVLVRAAVPGALTTTWYVIYAVGLVTAGLTAMYTTRMMLMTFFGEYRGSHTPHPTSSAMAIPLVILAALALLGGGLGLPGSHQEDAPKDGISELLPHYLEPAIAENAGHHLVSGETIDGIHSGGLIVGALVALALIALAYTIWNRPLTQVAWERADSAWTGLKDFLYGAWYYDDFVNKKGLRPATESMAQSSWRWLDDATVDRGAVDGTGRVAAELSSMTRGLQTGSVSRYAGYFTIGAVLLPLAALLGNGIVQSFLSLFGSGAAGH